MTFSAVQPVVALECFNAPPQGQWTYDDYAELPDDGHRYEIIDGVLYMAPAPATSHQFVSGWLSFYLMQYVQLAGKGRVLAAPYDVELAPTFVVQPDVIVVLNDNLGRIGPTRLRGIPDLVVEIISPSTAHYDRTAKQNGYARAGVPEYWIVDPESQAVEVLLLAQTDYYRLEIFQDTESITSHVVAPFPVPVWQFFL